MKKQWYYPTSFSAWGEEEHEAIQRVIASDQYTNAEEVLAFESEFAAYIGRKHAVFVNSGSSANLIAVAALFNKKEKPLKAGDKAVVPALAWSTTYAPLVQHGLDLVLADCDGTWNALPRAPRDARMLVTVPILGNPCHYDQHMNVKPEYWIDDCCESLGAWTGPFGTRKMVGSYGIMSTFSFFASHQLSAIEGGMVCTDDDEMNDLLRMLRDHGMTRYKNPTTFDTKYDFRLFGYNVRGLEMHAAIGREQLKKLEEFRRHREQGLNNFKTWAIGLPIAFPYKYDSHVMSPFGINFLVKDTETRQRVVDALRGHDIDCRPPTGGSFLKHRYSAKWHDQSTPNADTIHDNGLFLGLAPFDISEKIHTAVEIIRGVV